MPANCPRCLQGRPLVLERPMQARANKRFVVQCDSCRYQQWGSTVEAAVKKWNKKDFS